MPGTVTADYVTWRYYRYYVSSWTSGSGTQGSPHDIKYVLAPEGARRADLTTGGSTPDQDWGSMSDAAIAPYSDTYLEYVSGSDNRVSKAIMNGCGCSAGAGVPYLFTYDNATGYATAVGNTSYDAGWLTRAVVTNADGTYITQYFDEVGQVQAKVTTSSVPTGSPTRTWVNAVARDSSGRVTEIYSPESVTSYAHSSGAVGINTTGMITTYTRATGTSYRDGLLVGTGVKNGSGGSVTTLSAYTLSEQDRTVGATAVVQPRIATSAVYPAGSAETTTITTTFWSGTATDQQYLVPAKIVTTSPVVSTGKNGLNSATTTARWMRTDGSTAFSMDQAGIIGYSERDGFGLTIKRISDVNTGGTFSSAPFNDAPAGWSSFTAPSTSGTAIEATTTMAYDAQGRVITVTSPSAGTGTTQTSAMAYRTMGDGRLETFRFAAATGTVGSLTYYGPCQYGISNHAGRGEASATLAISSGITTLPSATPSGSSWQRLATSTYDETGTKLIKSKTYTVIPTTMPGSSGTNYDESFSFYDAMGRRDRSIDATGTIRRTVYE